MVNNTARRRIDNGFASVFVIILAVVIVTLVFIAVYLKFFSGKGSNPLSSLNSKKEEISIKINTDDKGKTETFTSIGGEISVSDAAGSITLSFPEKSILSTQTVTLNEMTSVENIPYGAKYIRGAHLEISDPTIVKPVKLTIPINIENSNDKVYGFAFDGKGDNFRLYPVSLVNGSAEFTIFHASGYGVITISDPKFKPYIPSDARAKAEQAIALAVSSQGIESGSPKITEILQNWYHDGVKLKLAKALSNSDLILDAVHEYLCWLGFAQFFGVDDNLTNEASDANKFITKALVNAYDKASSACVKDKDPGQISRLIKLAQIVQALAREGVNGLNSAEMLKKARECANFTLKITSNFKWNKGGDESCGLFEEDYSGEIPLTIDENFVLSGKGTVKLNKQLMCGNPCSVESGADPYTETHIIPNTILQASKDVKDITLYFQMETSDDTKMYCPFIIDGDEVGGSHESPAWLPSFISNELSMANPNPIISITGWEILGKGGVYARKIYNVDKPMLFDSEPEKEYTVLELIHNPK